MFGVRDLFHHIPVFSEYEYSVTRISVPSHGSHKQNSGFLENGSNDFD
jgi:hypothetical protein